MEREKICQNLMLSIFKTVKLEKPEKQLICQGLKMNSKMSKSSDIDVELAYQLVIFYFKHEKVQIKDLAKQFDKSVQSKMQTVFNLFAEATTIKPNEQRQELNPITQNPLFQQQLNQVDNDQLKCLNMINPNQNLMQLGIQTNSPQQLLAHGYNQSQMLAPYINGFSTFQTSQPQEIYQNYLIQQSMQNQYLHPQSNQGVNYLQQANMYGRSNTPEMMAGTGIGAFPTTTQNFMPSTINLGYQINSLPLQSQQIGYPSYLGSQTVPGTTQAVIDQNRLQNQMYYQTINGYTKFPETNYDQLVQQQYQTTQVANQQIKQQKITPTQKQLQGNFQQQAQQQYQMQLQSQLQAQITPQQQLQQAQNQQKTSQNTTQKQKQQLNGNQPLNTSQSTSTSAVVKNSKQIGQQAISQTSSKNSKLGIADNSLLKQQQNLGTSSKSKSKASNNSQVQSGNLNNFNGQNHLNYQFQQVMRNGSNTFSAKGVETEAIKSCICSQVPHLRSQQSELINCKNKGCEHKLHLSCMKISQKDEESIQQFECPSCILKKYDPLHHIEQTLVDCQVMMSKLTKVFDFQLTSENFNKLRENSEYCVEVRCIRVDGTKNIYETTWPDFGLIKMNNEQVLDLKPLQNNSSLKKRKDEKYTFKGTKFLKEGINSLQIQEFNCNPMEKQQMRITENALHCISVFLIRRLSPEQLAANIKKECTRPANECKQQIFDYFNRQKQNGEEDDDICIDSLSVPLTCSLDMKLIQTPAKGRYCKHFQCFSLENFILTTETVNPRKWRCNICKAKCYDIIVDEYLLQIIQEINNKQIKNVTDVKFDGKGQYSFDQQSYSDNDDDYDDDSNKLEVKKIQPINNQVTPINSTAIQNPIASNPGQITNVSNKGIISGLQPKGVSVENNSNSNATQMQQAVSSQNQQPGQNKRKQQIVLEIESDDEPPLQKKTVISSNQNKQIAISQIPQQFSQSYLQQQQQQQSLNYQTHNIANLLNNGIGTNGNFGIGINQVYSMANNSINPQVSGLMNQMTNMQSPSLVDQQSQKNMMNSNNSQQTSNPGNNTVNSSNIISKIPLINHEQDQPSNQSQNNYQNQSKKSISIEEEIQEPSQISNQLNLNNNNQQKSIPSEVNQKELIYHQEEIQKSIIGDKKSKETSTSSTPSKQEAFLSKQNIQQQQKFQLETQFQNQNQLQLQNQNLQLLKQLQLIQNQNEQKQPIQQEQQQQGKYQQEKQIILDSPKSDNNTQEITQLKQQKQFIEQQKVKIIQAIQSKENQKNLNNNFNVDFDTAGNNIGANISRINNSIQQDLSNQQINLQMYQMYQIQQFETQKIEEISQSGDQSKSSQQIHNEKDGQNIDKKQSEQKIQGDKSYLEDYLSKHNVLIKQNSIKDLSVKQTTNSGSNPQQNVPETINKFKLITGHAKSLSPQLSQSIDQDVQLSIKVVLEIMNNQILSYYISNSKNKNIKQIFLNFRNKAYIIKKIIRIQQKRLIVSINIFKGDGESIKRIYEIITGQGKVDNPITIDD